jgi:hypothetical protein
VKLPTSDEYIVLDDFPRFLDLAISSLAGQNDDASKRLSANLTFKKKWLASDQTKGLLIKKDVVEASGREGLAILLELINTHRSSSVA